MNHSESIAKLADALAKAHAEFKPVKKETKNPFFKSKYADLSTLIEATEDGLSKNGLVVVQSPGKFVDERKVFVLNTMLIHSSGEWLSDDLEMPVAKVDPQGVGSAITYARRYSYGAVLNVAGENDDDGNAASGLDVDHKAENSYKKNFEKRTADQARNITPAEAKVFWAAVKKGGKTEQQVKDRFKALKITGTADMHYSDYEAELKWAAGVESDYTETLRKSVQAIDAPQNDKHNFAKLFALAAKLNIPRDDVKRAGHEIYQVKSLNDLTDDQFSGLLEWMENQATA